MGLRATFTTLQPGSSNLLISYVTDYAGWVDKLSGESFLPEDGLMKIVQYELIGFCTALCAWNASLMTFV